MSKVMTSRLCITLSADSLKTLDQLCKALKVKRSEAIRFAVEHTAGEIRQKVNKKG